MDRQPLRELFQAARKQHRAGAGGILEILKQTAQIDIDELIEWLQDESGVTVLVSAPVAALPDFTLLDLETARSWRCVVLRQEKEPPILAAEDPWDSSLVHRVSQRAKVQVTPALVSTELLQRWISESTHGSWQPVKEALNPIEQASGPIVGFVDAAIRAAFELAASDIHFECDRSGVTVKHRLDGVMVLFTRLDGAERAQEVISRIKVLAQLDITERRLPQDGRFRFVRQTGSVDFRVSIMPSVFGEDAVLRLLDKVQLRKDDDTRSLDALGFDLKSAQLIRQLASMPSGMLLMTGPTGSGKTTTVYAILSEINSGHEKIITIEDPVEYELPGVLQIPVNERKGLTFAKGLRSILRHDPDRILVGEIRDAETAEIAIQSSLTGHLVFTTVHANGLTDIIGRFRHFGLDMFGFMSSLNGVVVQRLVRQLCSHCTGWRPSTAHEREIFARIVGGPANELPTAVGCTHCRGTGYQGRFVVAEVHEIDDAMRDLVIEGSQLVMLKKHASERGVEALATLSMRHVAQGRTTVEEVKRVVGWP